MDKEKTLKYLADMGIVAGCEQARSKIFYFAEAGLTDEEICRVLLAGENEAEQVLSAVRRRLLQDVHNAQAKLRKLDACLACIKGRKTGI